MSAPSWNRVIDDAARAMTDGAPAPDFRARVIARVSATQPDSRLTVLAWNWRGAAVAAAVAIGAIAVSVTQPFRSGEAPRVVGRLAAVAPAATPGDPVTTVEAPPRPRASRRSAAAQAPAALAEWRARNIPALDGLSAIEIEQIQPEWLSISQLSVRPLDIAPIAIPPIDEGRR